MSEASNRGSVRPEVPVEPCVDCTHDYCSCLFKQVQWDERKAVYDRIVAPRERSQLERQ